MSCWYRRRLSLSMMVIALITLTGELAAAQVAALRRIGGSVELGAEYDFQESESENADARRYERLRFEERVGLELGGFVLRPGLLRFDLGGTVGLRQEELDASDADLGSASGHIIEYNTRLDILSDRPVSLHLFANRFEDRSLLTFGSDTEGSGEGMGATLRVSNRYFPSALTWQQLRNDRESRGALVTTRQRTTRQMLEFSGSHFSEGRQARLRLRDEDVDDESIPSFGDYRIREADGMFTQRWGRYWEKTWTAGARYFQREGEFDFDSVSANSLFRWEITADLDTHLDYTFDRFKSNGQRVDSHHGSFNLNHRFYESIRTNVNLFSNLVDQTNGRSLAYGGGFLVSYQKELPWNSVFLADVGIQYRIEDMDAGLRWNLVNGEPLAIDEFGENYLANRRVDVASIEVLSRLDGRVLVEGIDYEVRVFGDRTAIEVLPGMDVVPGDVLLVNYAFEGDPGLKTETIGLRYGVGWDLGWLSIRYDHRESDQEAIEGVALGALQNSTTDTVRLDLRHRGRLLRATTSAQFLRDENETIAYDEIGVRQIVTWAPLRSVEIDAHARAAWRSFDLPENRTTRMLSGGASLYWRPERNRRIRLYAAARDWQDSTSVDQTDLEVGVEGRLEFGKIEIIPIVRWLRRERGETEVTDLRGGLRLIRRF